MKLCRIYRKVNTSFAKLKYLHCITAKQFGGKERKNEREIVKTKIPKDKSFELNYSRHTSVATRNIGLFLDVMAVVRRIMEQDFKRLKTGKHKLFKKIP